MITSYVLTLIGDANGAPLEQDHVARVCQDLAAPTRLGWLAEDEACDIFFDSERTAAQITSQARDVLSGLAFDAVCTPAKGRKKKLLISDMDSTVIKQECIDELGEAHGVGPQVRELTAAGIRGDIGFSSALRQRMALMKGMEHKLLEGVYQTRISLTPGARTLVQTMRSHGAYCILVSGGFTFFTSRICQRIGFHHHLGNELVFEDERLTGKVREPILGRSAKLNTMNQLCAEKDLGVGDVLAVGDGANDILMIQAAGLGVAFHGSDALKKQANATIDHGNLAALLYIQGFKKTQFVFA
ncbi:MAG: phosphoserine phosphatase SerB [Alphaproteobacteria bacterium]